MKCWLIKFKLTEIELIHFHPSGNPTPSENDNAFTARLRQAGELLGIELLDHVIVTDEATKYYSYREEGKI